MIQVHPQRAFLNTPIVISNKGTEPVLVQNKTTGEILALSPGESKSSQYPAGRYELLTKSFSGESDSAVFQVEDAWKFGGSEKKGSYIFDGNPWAVIVMKDRTYFFNGDTGEQFVEHNLSPNKIEELNQDFLMFSTGKDISLYSLRSMSVERTIPRVELVYNKKNHCIFSGNGRLTVYRFYPKGNEDRVLNIDCDAFVVQYIESKEEGVIRYHDRNTPRKVRTLHLFNAFNSKELESAEEFELEDEFVCFPGQHSVLLAVRENENTAPSSVYCVNLYSGRRVDIKTEDKPVSEINSFSIWRNKEYETICNEDIEGTARKYSLEVAEYSGYVCYIRTTHTVTTRKSEKITRDGEKQVFYKRSKSEASSLYDESGKEFLSASSDLSFIHESSRYYVSYSGSVYLILNKRLIKKEGRLLFTDFGDPYVVRTVDGGRHYYKLDEEEITCIDKKPEWEASDITKFGLFNQGEGRYFWLKTGKTVVGDSVKQFHLNPKPAIVSGGMADIKPRFFMQTGVIRPVPVPEQDILALSVKGTRVLYEKGGLFGIAQYSLQKWSFKENLQLSIYDTLHVKDAVFCSDGKSFIYQKKNKLVLYDFASGEETEFDTDKGIRNNVNGYRPYCTKDYFSRPVIVDPVSRRTIDHNFLSQYQFSNIEGNVYYVKREIHYFLRNGGKQISKEEYSALCKEYDYPRNPFGFGKSDETISDKRRKYLDSIGKGIGPGPYLGGLPLDLMVADFVKYRIVDLEEVAVISRNGDEVEVPIGDPLYYLNYVAFSPDAKRVAIAGKYKDASGLCVIYDMEKQEVLHRSVDGVGKTKAIWLASFNSSGTVAYYDSSPNTYLVKDNGGWEKVGGYSFLTFSPSGRFLALSNQGYIPYSEDEFWGHVPSCDIYIASINNPGKHLCHFNDHGSSIVGTGVRRETVATASFSSDERKILSVSNDGVVVIRNLHLE